MQAQTKYRLVRLVGIGLTPVISFLLVVIAVSSDLEPIPATLLVGLPLVLYATGGYLILRGLATRANGTDSLPQ